jgi:hypothetical protein
LFVFADDAVVDDVGGGHFLEANRAGGLVGGVGADHGPEVHRGDDVSVEHEEAVRGEVGFAVLDGACGAQRLVFLNDDEFNASALPLRLPRGEVGAESLRFPVDGDDDAAHLGRQAVEHPFHHGAACDWQQGLRTRVGQGAKARAVSASKKNRIHGVPGSPGGF